MSIDEILLKLKRGTITVEDAKKSLELLSVINVENFAKLDVCRGIRKGVPEIVYAENKTPTETVKIAEKMAKRSGRAIISRLSENHLKELRKLKKKFKVEIFKKARMVVISLSTSTLARMGGRVGVLTAGTADIGIAEEASIVLREAGCEVYTAYDVGVAGFHRLLGPLREMIAKDVDVIIVVAGMEGALPSVVASFVNCPVIGVPSSSGYGYGGQGQAALMSMLQSCTPGLAVVNIDNGVGAGALASIIANRMAKARKR